VIKYFSTVFFLILGITTCLKFFHDRSKHDAAKRKYKEFYKMVDVLTATSAGCPAE